MKVIEGLKERYRAELIRKIQEKLDILFDKYDMEDCRDIVFDCKCRLINHSPYFTRIWRTVYNDYYFVIDFGDYESYSSLEDNKIDTSILEYLAYNAFVGCQDYTNHRHLSFTRDMIV